MYGASKSHMGSVMSTSGAKTAKSLKYDQKLDAQEDKKLNRMAAEAQAFLLKNQGKQNNTAALTEIDSMSSISKGTINQSVAGKSDKADSVAKSIKTTGRATKAPTTSKDA